MNAEPKSHGVEAGWDNRIYLLPPGAVREVGDETVWRRIVQSESWGLLLLELKAVALLAIAAAIVVGGQHAPRLWQMIQGGLQ